MKILQINKFFYLKGGPERYMFSLSELLKAKGHKIAFFSMKHDKNEISEWDKYFVKNVDYDKKHNLADLFCIFKNTLYSRESENKLSSLVDYFKPDVAHLHGFNHQLTPSIIFALKNKNVPMVMTMHDYKLTCPSYLMLNHDKLCELCGGGKFFNCFKTRCYKDSVSKCFLLTLESYLHHNILKSYKHISHYICPSRFIMDKSKQMGLRGSFTHISNFVDINKFKPGQACKGNKFIYFGRLSKEKGLHTLIAAAKGLPIELTIIGDGPIRHDIEYNIKKEDIKNIRLTGHLDDAYLFDEVSGSVAVVVPSEWYENNPISILEAFALGKPVIASRIGGISELVKENVTGLLFEPHNPEELRDRLQRLSADADEALMMGRNGRAVVENECNAEFHYKQLMDIYSHVIKR